MTKLLYPKLAWIGIRKNKRMYFPFILTCICMIAMQYIIGFLSVNQHIASMRGGDAIQSMLAFGICVMAIFSVIFLFYSHSFLIRRRKKEFGLYNILGMGKRNIALIMLVETIMIAVISLGLGFGAGIALSKLAELGLVNMIKGEVTSRYFVEIPALYQTALIFCGIFVLLLLNSLWQVGKTQAINLLQSEHVGEKKPKANYLFAIAGALILGAAYYVAVSIKDPVAALGWFFVAVVMVIVATYLLFISGSVTLCRILQKNKRYYYKPNHFVSVSSMAYRMKRNGAGLASICILITMVLVMISSTACLYFGNEDALTTRYPKDINVTVHTYHAKALNGDMVPNAREGINEIAKQFGAEVSEAVDYRAVCTSGYLQNGVIEIDPEKVDSSLSGVMMSNVYQIYFIPLSDYNAMSGTNETLAEGEALYYGYRADFDGDSLSFNGGQRFEIVKKLDQFVGNGDIAMNVVGTIVLVVPDIESAIKGLDTMVNASGGSMLHYKWYYNFNTGLDADDQIDLHWALREKFSKFGSEEEIENGYMAFSMESRQLNRDGFYGTFGGLFFLGILLSIVFIIAAVLIIYYKQLSEGYEDQSRFAIMQKVGMTKKEIRRSIDSQMLTVFFLPIAAAAMHVGFAFPMIRKLLLLFNMNNVTLFLRTTVISIVVFGLFYAFVYRITSNIYCQIVSSGKRE